MSRRFISPIILAIFVACVPAWFAGCKSVAAMTADGDKVTFTGVVYPKGEWKATIRGFNADMQPGEMLQWNVDFAMEGKGFSEFSEKIHEVDIVIAALRICDGDGIYKEQDGYFSSSYLTPSGLAVEGYQYLIPNSKIGGPYKTPLDHAQAVELSRVRIADRKIDFHAPVSVRLPEDFPPGLYRIEIAFYAAVDDAWLKLPMIRTQSASVEGCDVDYEALYFAKNMTPPVRIGRIKPPRMIWTLFNSIPSRGLKGVVAREDAPHFAVSGRIKPPAQYVLPCQPDRGECVYRIEPNLPTVTRNLLFGLRELPIYYIEPDWSEGEVAVRVKRPDGAVDDLGRHSFWYKGVFGPRTLSGKLEYRFGQFGKYEISMTGFMLDRFGNRYEAGGTYDVWIAYPLTFATGIKPGNPMSVGQYYSPAATINPPVPADVKATVDFYPGTHPKDVVRASYSGKAQRFGYYFPDASQPMLRFPEAGEYRFEIFATYTDKSGRLYMGSMTNAAVVLPKEPNLIVHGIRPDWQNLTKEPSPTLDGSRSMNLGNIFLPYKSGDMIYSRGYGPNYQVIQPAMNAEEPTGRLLGYLRTHFPKRLLALEAGGADRDVFSMNTSMFPGNQEQIRNYARDNGMGKTLPLMSDTTRGWSPFSYPELVKQRGYFYIATSRPGFPVFYAVTDSTIFENYWGNTRDDYVGTVGAAGRGDQPGDVQWTVASGIFVDPDTDTALYGLYSTGGVILPRGSKIDAYTGPPFEKPVANVHGRDIYIYGGVGPSPGTLYETGAVKGVGSVAVPMAPHDVRIDVHLPDGRVHECRGRADEIGNFTCPAGPLHLDVPGVYKVFSHFQEGEREGTCPGSRDGWYSIYAVEKDSPYNVLFSSKMPAMLDPEAPLAVEGRIDPPLKSGTVYYSIVTPGILMDEGAVGIDGSRFRFQFPHKQFSAQFANLVNLTGLQGLLAKRGFSIVAGLLDYVLEGSKVRPLADTVEIVVFVEGESASGERVTAGGKLALRGPRVVIPEAFVDF